MVEIKNCPLQCSYHPDCPGLESRFMDQSMRQFLPEDEFPDFGAKEEVFFQEEELPDFQAREEVLYALVAQRHYDELAQQKRFDRSRW